MGKLVLAPVNDLERGEDFEWTIRQAVELHTRLKGSHPLASFGRIHTHHDVKTVNLIGHILAGSDRPFTPVEPSQLLDEKQFIFVEELDADEYFTAPVPETRHYLENVILPQAAEGSILVVASALAARGISDHINYSYGIEPSTFADYDSGLSLYAYDFSENDWRQTA